MAEFDNWMRWGLGLSDKEFANAYTALGVLTASTPRIRTAGKKVGIAQSTKRSDPEPALKKMLASELSEACGSNRPLPWQYPAANTNISLRGRKSSLSSIDPKSLAKCWSAALSSSGLKKFLIAVSGYPDNELIKPWFRLVLESDPGNQSAFLELPAPHEHLFWKWPIRLGYLPGNNAENIVKDAVFYWPANELARATRIGRDNANCDVLMFDGSLSQLLKALLDLAVPHKCNLIVCRGALEDGSAAGKELRSAVTAKSKARGYVFLKPETSGQDLPHALKAFVEHLSHNEAVDQAVCGAFARDYKMDPAVFMSHDLAELRIEHLVKQAYIRLKSMEPGARIDIKPDTLARMGLATKAEGKDIGNARELAKILSRNKSKITYHAESSGATGLAEINEGIKKAEPPAENRGEKATPSSSRMRRPLKHAVKKGPQRFLKQLTLIKRENEFVPERRALFQGIPTLIRVHIGYPDDVYTSLRTVFPGDKLPPNVDKWRLTVVFAEPNNVKVPMRKDIILPREGQSEECEFAFVPAQHGAFEGRVTVLHRGRVLQTGVISAVVLPNEQVVPPPDARIDFTEQSQVRSHMEDLDDRRQFDLAFVMNHSADQRPRLTAIAEKHAWLSDLSACEEIIRDLNTELSKVGNQERDYRGGLSNKDNIDLLATLARIGRELYGAIVLDQLMDPGNQQDFGSKFEYIQIVSTRTDALMPMEFIYTADAPKKGATLCPKMKAVIEEADAKQRKDKARTLFENTCKRAEIQETPCEYRTNDYVCPMGFWGVSKVIERHMVTPALRPQGYDFFLQSEQTTLRPELDLSGTAIVAASEKVAPSMVNRVLSACTENLGAPSHEAKDWDQWVKLIDTYTPRVLIAMPHTDKNGPNATLEIKGKTLASSDVTPGHVHKTNEKTYPLVALLGCDTAGTAVDYGAHINWFRRYEAALVISTIAKVFGGHAADVAEQLVKGLTEIEGRPERIGEIIRQIKQKALLGGPLMALCVVAFGDADWKLKRKEN